MRHTVEPNSGPGPPVLKYRRGMWGPTKEGRRLNEDILIGGISAIQVPNRFERSFAYS
jgi:hypothetical protein